MDIKQIFLALLVIALAFILISKYMAESTVRLLFQVVLGAALLWVVLEAVGVFAS